MEAGTHSPWVGRVLEECGHEVLVADPPKRRLICTNKRKTDEIAAENLAHLLYTELLKERELPESADRSIARRGQNPLHSATDSSRHVGLDKMAFS